MTGKDRCYKGFCTTSCVGIGVGRGSGLPIGVLCGLLSDKVLAAVKAFAGDS